MQIWKYKSTYDLLIELNREIIRKNTTNFINRESKLNEPKAIKEYNKIMSKGIKRNYLLKEIKKLKTEKFFGKNQAQLNQLGGEK